MAAPQEALKSHAMKFTLLSKNVLSLEETELYELTQLTGVLIDPKVFKIILDLIKMNVSPSAIVQVLKAMRSRDKFIITRSNQPIVQPRSTKSESDTGRNVKGHSESTQKRGHSTSKSSSNISSRSSKS